MTLWSLPKLGTNMSLTVLWHFHMLGVMRGSGPKRGTCLATRTKGYMLSTVSPAALPRKPLTNVVSLQKLIHRSKMSIRDTVAKLLDGDAPENKTHTSQHLSHCYDALRQAIICRADDTPLYVPKQTFFAGDGQQRRCRSWAKLEDWVIQHTACYGPVRC